MLPSDYLLFQVDLSDSESEDCGNDSVEGGGKDDAMGRSRRAGDLGVNKKGTPLYSREDIREQYCINDKELQVLDKSGRKGILGCFSNNGQVKAAVTQMMTNFEGGCTNHWGTFFCKKAKEGIRTLLQGL